MVCPASWTPHDLIAIAQAVEAPRASDSPGVSSQCDDVGRRERPERVALVSDANFVAILEDLDRQTHTAVDRCAPIGKECPAARAIDRHESGQVADLERCI
jgi:hypothetical protein